MTTRHKKRIAIVDASRRPEIVETTLPFYKSAPNAADYFPSESFIPIDINDFEGSQHVITHAIRNNEYEKRLPAIREARKRVLEEYNFYATIARLIEDRDQARVATNADKPIYLRSRHDLRKNPMNAVLTNLEKIRNKCLSKFRQMATTTHQSL